MRYLILSTIVFLCYHTNVQNDSSKKENTYKVSSMDFPKVHLSDIDTLIIESGTCGNPNCLQYISKYVFDGTNFIKLKESDYKHEWRIVKPLGLSPTKDQRIIEELLTYINDESEGNISWTDLDIQPVDIENFKKQMTNYRKKIEADINEFGDVIPSEPRSWLLNEYSFFESLVSIREVEQTVKYARLSDSIFLLPDSIINSIFTTAARSYISASFWRTIKFILSNGSVVKIYNTEYTPNYYYTTWTIEYKGNKRQKHAIQLSKLIDQISEGKILQSAIKSKNYAIYQLVEYIRSKDNTQ